MRFQARVAAAESLEAVSSRVAAHLRPEQNRSSALLGMLSTELLALRMLKLSTDSLVSCCKRPCSRIAMPSPCRQADVSAVALKSLERTLIFGALQMGCRKFQLPLTVQEDCGEQAAL